MTRVIIILTVVLVLPMVNFAKSPSEAKRKQTNVIEKMGVTGFGDPLTEIYRRPASEPKLAPTNGEEPNWGLLNRRQDADAHFQLYQGKFTPSAERMYYIRN